MSFFKKLFFLPNRTGTYYLFSVKCNRCNEIIPGQVNINNEPSLEMNEQGKPFFICRKVLIGNGFCFQQIEVVLIFDENRHVLRQTISGGEFVEE